MSIFKYEKLILETAKALQCFIEQYKRDKAKSNIELNEDKIKLITKYALLNLSEVNNQKDFNVAVESFLKDLKTDNDNKHYIRYNNTWKEINLNTFKSKDGYSPYIQNGKWFLNNVDLGVRATGESAYEIAKRLNKPNTDTEDNWINSLKGAKGDKGEQGQKGDKGEPGGINQTIIDNINKEIEKKVNKETGKGLSSNDYTNTDKQKLDSIDLSTKLDKGTFTGTAKDLFDKLSNIETVLKSNDVNLDTLQELVDFVKINRVLLGSIGIDNIVGLKRALEEKAPLNHTHKWTDITEKPEIKKVDSKYTIEGLNGEIVVPTLPAWVSDTKPTYNWSEIIDKPSLNYLPLTGGMITPTEGGYREGIRIGDKDGWSLVHLGAVNVSGTTENSWTVARKPDNSFQISNGDISSNRKKGLNLTPNVLTFSDDTKSLLEVSNELVHTNKMFDAPIFRIHTTGVDYVSLNSKNNKLNVKDGNDGRDGNNFKPVLASGYEINGKTDNEVVLAGGGVTNLDSLKNENIKIGERNYLLNSKQTLITSTPTGIMGVFGVSPDLKKILSEQPTTLFIVSCFIKYTNLKSVSPKGRLGFEGLIEYTDGTPQYINYWLNVSDSDVGKSINGERFYRVITLLPNKTVKDIRISGMFVQITADQAEVSNPKIELGNKPTDWTPAPEDFDFYKEQVDFSELKTFKNRPAGSWGIRLGGGGGIYVNFPANSSASSLEFFKPNWYPATRIGVRNSVDANRFNEDNGEFRDLAWYDDVLRAGVECTQNTTLQKVHQNQTLFVTIPCNIELNTIDDLSSVSFRKVFDSGVVSFSCTGKNIIYTADNQFNGKKGSTAVISRYGNDCYIDIRNI